MDAFKKQPYETFVVGADFSKVLKNDETITDTNATALDKNGAVASESVIDNSSISEADGIMSVRVQAGEESLSPYKLTFRIISSAANKYELDVKMYVREL